MAARGHPDLLDLQGGSAQLQDGEGIVPQEAGHQALVDEGVEDGEPKEAGRFRCEIDPSIARRASAPEGGDGEGPHGGVGLMQHLRQDRVGFPDGAQEGRVGLMAHRRPHRCRLGGGQDQNERVEVGRRGHHLYPFVRHYLCRLKSLTIGLQSACADQGASAPADARHSGPRETDVPSARSGRPTG